MADTSEVRDARRSGDKFIRIPAQQLDALKARANANERSAAAELRVILSEHLDEAEPAEAAA